MKHSMIMWMLLLCASTPALAQTRAATGGNPVSALPQINAPQQTPNVTVKVEQQSPQLQQLLSRVLTPSKVQIEGVKAVPFADVANHFMPMIGHPTKVADLISAANEVTELYKTRGYALSFAFVPAQTFADGVVKITVVEGYVQTINITGKSGATEAKIRAIAQHIAEDRPLRLETFQHYINVLGLLPGVKIAATVAPPQTTDGAATLVLDVDRKAFNISSGLNLNHPGIQALITVTENGLTPLGEQLSFTALEPRGPDHQTYYAASAALPIGSHGLITHVDASRYSGQPEDNPGLPGYVHRNVLQEKVGISAAYPIIFDNTHSLTGTVSAYASHDQDVYNNTITDASIGLRSQVRVLQTQMDYASVKDGVTRKASFNVAKAFNVLGASKSGDSNIPGTVVTNGVSLNFVRTGATLQQSNEWPYHIGTVVTVTGQYSPDSLPTSEQISFGAQRFALGYEPGETSGDSGWGASFEVNRAFLTDLTYLKSVTPYVSFDTARVYLHAGPTQPNRLASIAVGFRITDKKYYSLDLSVGKPVGDAPIESHSRAPRVNAAFSYSLN